MSAVEKNYGVAATACTVFQPRLSSACSSASHTSTALPIAFSDQHRIVEVTVRTGEKDCRLKLLAARYDDLFELLQKRKLREVVQG